MTTIKLKANDTDEPITVDVKAACCSQTIKTMLNDCENTVGEAEVVPVGKINHATLTKVIEWMTYHKDDPPPEEENKTIEKRTDDISPWDAEFINVDKDMLFDLVRAANFLDVKPLLDLTCKTLANMIKGKSTVDIRSTFNIRNDR